MRRIRPLVAAVLVLVAPIAAHAQTWGVQAALGPAPELRLRLDQVPRDGGEVDAFAVVGADPALGVAIRWSDALGPLGTVVIEGDAEARLGGPVAARAAVGARGVLGPVAARLRIGVDGAPPTRFASAPSSSGKYAITRSAAGMVSGPSV